MRRGWTPLLLLLLSIHRPACGAQGAGATTEPVGEIRRGVVMEGTPEERGRRAMERVVQKIEPSLKGNPARLAQYVEFFKREFVQDPRTFAFDASAELAADGTVVVTGYAEYPEHAEAISRLLDFLGFAKVQNRIERLPADSIGVKRFALVRVAHATIVDKPSKPRENVSQALLGDPVFLLKEDAGYFLCHTSEGYVGYVAAGDVVRVTAEELARSQAYPRATLVGTISTAGVTLPAAAHLHVSNTQGGNVLVTVPAAGDVPVPSASVTVTRQADAIARVAPVLEAAKAFMGTKYVWGGKSLDGIDCSGLVQTAFETRGVRLPRDADQQGYVGQLVATRWYRSDLRPGDTLYFLARTGKIHHTALYLGNGQYVEAANPGVKITSFDPAAPNYDPKRDKSFCFAKRILD